MPPGALRNKKPQHRWLGDCGSLHPDCAKERAMGFSRKTPSVATLAL
jgi:hypothetical protein